MAITKEKKVAILEEFSNIVSGVDSYVFVRFNKLDVKNATILRRKLRSSGLGYKVGKKTLLKKALADQKIEGELPTLDGEVALAYPLENSAEDKTLTAREIYDFQKSNKESVVIIGGVFEGKYKSLEEMMEIATIPSVDVLRGMFVNIINSPIQRMVIALNEIAKTKTS